MDCGDYGCGPMMLYVPECCCLPRTVFEVWCDFTDDSCEVSSLINPSDINAERLPRRAILSGGCRAKLIDGGR